MSDAEKLLVTLLVLVATTCLLRVSDCVRQGYPMGVCVARQSP